jgi:hypothetical protein
MTGRKRAARKQSRPRKATKRQTRRATPKPRGASTAEDVVYTDVRREMRSRLLARFL